MGPQTLQWPAPRERQIAKAAVSGVGRGPPAGSGVAAYHGRVSLGPALRPLLLALVGAALLACKGAPPVASSSSLAQPRPVEDSAAVAATPAKPATPAIVAHRGASADAPENTLAAFRLGFEQGADAIEGDFWLSADGVIVTMHDATLERTAGDPRAVTELSVDELGRLDVGAWGPWSEGPFVGEPVPTLFDVLAMVPEGKGILIEIKDSVRIVDALLRELDRAGLAPEQVAIISFDAEVIAHIEERAPARTTYWLTGFREQGGQWSPTAADIVETARRLGADGVDLQAEAAVIDADFVTEIRAAGLELHVWTVDDAEHARALIELGVDSITTNVPAKLRAALSR